jgi:hypothetical protein
VSLVFIVRGFICLEAEREPGRLRNYKTLFVKSYGDERFMGFHSETKSTTLTRPAHLPALDATRNSPGVRYCGPGSLIQEYTSYSRVPILATSTAVALADSLTPIIVID